MSFFFQPKASLTFSGHKATAGICILILQAKSTKQSLDRDRKALFYNHNDLDY